MAHLKTWIMGGALILTLIVVTVIEKWGGGRLSVVAPSNAVLTVEVDGVEETQLEPGVHKTMSMKRGTHRVVLKSERGTVEQQLEIVDSYSWTLMAARDQCLVLLDISGTYVAEGGTPSKPELLRQLAPGESAALTGNVFFEDRGPPTQKPGEAKITMVVQRECSR